MELLSSGAARPSARFRHALMIFADFTGKALRVGIANPVDCAVTYFRWETGRRARARYGKAADPPILAIGVIRTFDRSTDVILIVVVRAVAPLALAAVLAFGDGIVGAVAIGLAAVAACNGNRCQNQKN